MESTLQQPPPVGEPPAPDRPSFGQDSHDDSQPGRRQGPPHAAPRRLYRAPKGLLGGVARGFAAYFDIDPVITRLLFLAALASGFGLPMYLVCWVVIPKATEWPPRGSVATPERERGKGALTSGLVILMLVALTIAGFHGNGRLLWPAALLGLGIYLLHQRPEQAGTVSVAQPAPSASRVDQTGHSAVSPQVDPEPTESNQITATVLSLLALGLGTALALRAAGLVTLSVSGLAAGGLVIVGGGLVASLWRGRARGLIPIGLLLSAALAAASAAEPWLAPAGARRRQLSLMDRNGTFAGERHVTPRTLGALEPSYGLGLGELDLDLSHLDFSGEARSVDIQVGIGEVHVHLPPGVAVRVHAKIGVGELNVLGTRDMKVDVSDTGQDQGSLSINLEIGVGEGDVTRAP